LPGQGLGEVQVVQHARAQFCGNAAHRRNRRVKLVAHVVNVLRRRLAAFLDAVAKPGQAELEAGELLAQVIVQLA